MTDEMKRQIKENETTVNRWKEEHLARILNQSVSLPESAAMDFYKIGHRGAAIYQHFGYFIGDYTFKTLREKIDVQMPELWELFPPPKTQTEWDEYFDDLLIDCAADNCMTVKEVFIIIGYDTTGFEERRDKGFSFAQAFNDLYEKETDEQMDERTKDLSLEQYQERTKHLADQARESFKKHAKFRNEAFKKFGVNLPAKEKQD
jgi:hypothetical protein